MQHDTVAAGCARNAKRFHKPGCGFLFAQVISMLNVSDVSGLWETRGGGHAALSDTSALSHYSLVSIEVCREIVISINYNYNELDSSEISIHETALKGRRTLQNLFVLVTWTAVSMTMLEKK